MTRVLIAEDQTMMRDALTVLLGLEDGFEVVAPAGTAGEIVVDPALAAAALSAGPNPLTPREREVLAAAADGSTAADISRRLHLPESTVRNHLSACITKTGTRKRMEAVRAARHSGRL